MKKIVIIGAGKAAQMLRAYIELTTPDRVVGYSADAAYCTTDRFDDRPLVPWEQLEQHFTPDEVHLIGPASFSRINQFRYERHQEGRARGYRFTSFIHPTVRWDGATIGENVIILDDNILQPFSHVGDGVVLWSASIIGHHCIVGDYCFISSYSALAGSVTLGKFCYLGAKIFVTQNVTIGDSSVLVNGAMIGEDLPERSVVKGALSQPMRIKSDRIQHLL
jgi:sugar O-acyltransferase (sialic acid O-acetyltransferase NeuD family)